MSSFYALVGSAQTVKFGRRIPRAEILAEFQENPTKSAYI